MIPDFSAGKPAALSGFLASAPQNPGERKALLPRRMPEALRPVVKGDDLKMWYLQIRCFNGGL